MDTMTPTELLAFEQAWPNHTPDKDAAIRKQLGVTPARYYQLLTRAAHTEEGIAANPITARMVRARSSA
jgi:hypothetical protein